MNDTTFPTEVIAAITAVSGLIVLGLFYLIFKNAKNDKSECSTESEVIHQPVARRAIGNRNRVRGTASTINVVATNEGNNTDSLSERDSSSVVDTSDFKMGAKKRAKMEAKAEKKAQREVELKLREERKLQREKEEANRKLQEEKERLEEEKQEEEKKRLEEEKEKREEEEYQKMKAQFAVVEEGFDAGAEDLQTDLLQEFISFIQEEKVVRLEELAAKFHLKIQTVINRINELISTGVLTGVIDDRGKFIYITMDELNAVADFVKKRGRVSIQELVENSNKLVSLN